MITLILIVAVLLIVALVILVAAQPTDFRISRSLAIPAPASFLFEQVDDLRLWEAWSPWIKMEPDIQKTFEGPSSGVGATYSWVGKKTGSGRMVTIESRPNELLRFDLHFLKPFEATHISEFTFKPEGDQTIVTWSMTGKNKFINKAFVLVMDCDKMIGGQFASGLENLKEVARQTVPV